METRVQPIDRNSSKIAKGKPVLRVKARVGFWAPSAGAALEWGWWVSGLVLSSLVKKDSAYLGTSWLNKLKFRTSVNLWTYLAITIHNSCFNVKAVSCYGNRTKREQFFRDRWAVLIYLPQVRFKCSSRESPCNAKNWTILAIDGSWRTVRRQVFGRLGDVAKRIKKTGTKNNCKQRWYRFSDVCTFLWIKFVFFFFCSIAWTNSNEIICNELYNYGFAREWRFVWTKKPFVFKYRGICLQNSAV